MPSSVQAGVGSAMFTPVGILHQHTGKYWTINFQVNFKMDDHYFFENGNDLKFR